MFTWHFPEHTKPPAALPEFTFVLNTSVGTSIEIEADRNEQQGPGVDQININTLCGWWRQASGLHDILALAGPYFFI